MTCHDPHPVVSHDLRLDTVDQAERTATFMAAEKQNQASTKAQSTISAMAKNLGPDSEGEDEEVWEDDGMMGRVGEIWAGGNSWGRWWGNQVWFFEVRLEKWHDYSTIDTIATKDVNPL